MRKKYVFINRHKNLEYNKLIIEPAKILVTIVQLWLNHPFQFDFNNSVYTLLSLTTSQK